MTKQGLITRLELADLLSVTPRSIDRFVDEGMPVTRRGKGRKPAGYRPKDCVSWYVERERAALLGNGELSPQKERALLDRKRREELELRLEVRRGELVPIEEVSRDFADCAAAVKARLRRIPDAVADRVRATDGPFAVKALLLAEIDDALRELAAKADALTDATAEPAA